MADYKKMYHVLFNALTDVIEQLQKAQEKTEEIYIETTDEVAELDEENEGRSC